MDVFVFAVVVMVMIIVAGASTHRTDIIKIEAIWMMAWVGFAVIDTEATLKFSPLAALGAYLVLLLLPNLKKEI